MLSAFHHIPLISLNIISKKPANGPKYSQEAAIVIYTAFPSGTCSSGMAEIDDPCSLCFYYRWNKQEAFIPDINHGLEVQRIVRETAEKLTGNKE